MGLAASQARLLMLTSRKGDVEGSLTNLANQKLSMARQSSDLSQAYSDALSAKTMTWNTTATTSGTTPLNYDLLMTPSTNNTSGQYLIADNYGRVMLNDEYSQYFNGGNSSVTSGNNAGSETLPKFLVAMGVATTEAGATTIINDKESKSSSGKALTTMATDVSKLLSYAISDTGTSSGKYYNDNTIEAFKTALNKVSSDITSEIKNISGLTDTQMNYLESNDQYTNLRYDSTDSTKTLASPAFMATMGCGSTSVTGATLQWTQTAKQALTYGAQYTYTATMPDGTTATKTSITGQTQRGGSDSTTITNTSLTGTTVSKTATAAASSSSETTSAADTAAETLFIAATGIPATTTKNTPSAGTISEQYKELEYLVRMQRAVVAAQKMLEFFGGSNTANEDFSEISTSISLLLEGGTPSSYGSSYNPGASLIELTDGNDGGDPNHDAINGDGTSYTSTFFDYDYNGAWGNAQMGATKVTMNGSNSKPENIIFTEDVNDLFGNYSTIRSERETANPTTTADDTTSYYINLWKAINTKGWSTSNKALNKNNDTDGSYLQNSLLNGGAYLYALQDNGTWKIASTSDSNTPINTETDSNAISAAEAKYTAAKDQLTYKEDEIDMKSNDLDTERSAITTEMESVKKIIDSNIKVLKMFSTDA